MRERKNGTPQKSISNYNSFVTEDLFYRKKNLQCKRWKELFNNFGNLMCIVLISNIAKQRSDLLFLGINKMHVMDQLQLIVVDIQL